MRAKASTAIYRPDLGQVVFEYAEGPTMGLIGLELMPIYKTPVAAASYPVIPQEVMLKLPDVSRAPRGHYSRDDWEYERGIFSTSEKGREELIDDSERKLMDQEAPGASDLIAVERAWKFIMKAQEKRISSKVFDASTFSAVSVTNEWDDPDNAVPVEDVNTGKLVMRSACGMLPDVLVISYYTFQKLKNVDSIVNLLKYTFPMLKMNKMTTTELAAVFDVPRVLVGGAVYDSAGKGITANITDIWDNEYAALVKISSGADLRQPGFGRTFLWTADSPQDPVVEQYREEQVRSDVFRVRHTCDEVLMQSKNDSGSVVSNIADACIYLMDNITT